MPSPRTCSPPSATASRETFNIACGETITLNALLEELRGIIGVDAEADYGEPRPGDVRNSLADISRARDALGYEPAIGLRRVGEDRGVAEISNRGGASLDGDSAERIA